MHDDVKAIGVLHSLTVSTRSCHVTCTGTVISQLKADSLGCWFMSSVPAPLEEFQRGYSYAFVARASLPFGVPEAEKTDNSRFATRMEYTAGISIH